MTETGLVVSSLFACLIRLLYAGIRDGSFACILVLFMASVCGLRRNVLGRLAVVLCVFSGRAICKIGFFGITMRNPEKKSNK